MKFFSDFDIFRPTQRCACELATNRAFNVEVPRVPEVIHPLRPLKVRFLTAKRQCHEGKKGLIGPSRCRGAGTSDLHLQHECPDRARSCPSPSRSIQCASPVCQIPICWARPAPRAWISLEARSLGGLGAEASSTGRSHLGSSSHHLLPAHLHPPPSPHTGGTTLHLPVLGRRMEGRDEFPDKWSAASN